MFWWLFWRQGGEFKIVPTVNFPLFPLLPVYTLFSDTVSKYAHTNAFMPEIIKWKKWPSLFICNSPEVNVAQKWYLSPSLVWGLWLRLTAAFLTAIYMGYVCTVGLRWLACGAMSRCTARLSLLHQDLGRPQGLGRESWQFVDSCHPPKAKLHSTWNSTVAGTLNSCFLKLEADHTMKRGLDAALGFLWKQSDEYPIHLVFNIHLMSLT